MARHKQRRRRPRSGPDHFEGETAEDLARALGIEGLSLESCAESLFGELLEEMGVDTGAPPGEGEDVYRVVQTGPGRRDKSKEGQ